MSFYYRWSEKDSPDNAQWKARKLVYTYNGAPSRKAFWVFQMGGIYRPSSSVIRDRILLVFDFGPAGDNVIQNPYNWVHFPSPQCKGETSHPRHIIVKDSEPGSFGIGTTVRENLPILTIRCATRDELIRAGVHPTAIRRVPTW
jgi:hypothetical protein